MTLIKLRLTPIHHPLRMTYERNSDIFLEKVGSEEIFQLLNYKGISELFFFDAIPSLKLSFNPQQAAASESFNRQGGGGRGKIENHLYRLYFSIMSNKKHTKVP